MKACKKVLWLSFFLLMVQAVSANTGVNLIKVGFISKFAKYTHWKKDKADNEFRICIIGDNEFGSFLRSKLKDKRIKNRPIRIELVKDLNLIEKCHILYVGESQKENLDKIIQTTCINNTLTVSDSPGFGKMGVHINFFHTTEGTLHFELNLKNLEKAELDVDFLLMNVAKIL